MRVLYAVFVLCTVALLWAVIAVTRHIRRHQAAVRRAARHDETAGSTTE
jgi:hypothetical protein